MERALRVTDTSGMLAVLDPDGYQSYMGRNGDLDQIGGHFVAEMARHAPLIWPTTGCEDYWTVEVADSPRAFDPADIGPQDTGLIRCTNGRLLVTNNESLTMAGMYQAVTLPQPHEKDHILEIPSGLYTCQATQVGRGYRADDVEYRYVVTLTPGGDLPPWRQAPWARDDFQNA